LKNSRTFAFAAAAVLLCAAASFAAPQDPPATAQDPPATPPPPSPPRPPLVDAHTPRLPQTTQVKLDKYKGRVLVFNIATIVVQSMENQRMVWSFQYSTDLHSKVADMLSGGGYQPGDKVEVYCKPGTTVAVKLKGRPSKPV
jgi:hypothetical protein